jgi:hypothetical protein
LVNELRTRTLIKTIAWRIVATINSYLVLTFNFSKEALINALIMNLTGFVIYYLFERIVIKIPYGKQ